MKDMTMQLIVSYSFDVYMLEIDIDYIYINVIIYINYIYWE